MLVPRKIRFQLIGDPQIGYLSVAEQSKNIPFEIKRVYWVYSTPDHVERGNHANHVSEHVIICLTGKTSIYLENTVGEEFQYELDNPNEGLYIPAMYWRRLKMNPDTVCLSISSTIFEEKDYIRDYQEFLKLKN